MLMLLAASCGAIWTWQRAATGGLAAGLLTHLTWSLLVLVLFPLVP